MYQQKRKKYIKMEHKLWGYGTQIMGINKTSYTCRKPGGP
jgi:hypothetical protein